jgi:hypothetical protein
MSRTDLATRAAASLAIVAVLVNLLVAWEWFAALAWVVVGFYWAFLGLFLLLEGAVWLYVLARPDAVLARRAVWGGLGLSLLNINPLTVAIDAVALGVLLVASRPPAGDPDTTLW